MSPQPVIYSCVTDGTPKYEAQASIWAATLSKLGDAPSSSIVVHAMRPTRALRAFIEGLGASVVEIEPTLPGWPHLRKLSQLDSPALTDANVVVLCDCDLAFAASISDWIHGLSVRAKIVDYANPPLRVWRSIFEAAGLGSRVPSARPTCGSGKTYAANFNGGLYVLPQHAYEQLRSAWPQWSAWLLNRPEIVGAYGHHTDQIAFGLAIAATGLTSDSLPLEANCPSHIRLDHPPSTMPAVIHYHGASGGAGLLATGHPLVDAAIARINGVLESSLFDDLKTRTARG